MCVREGKLASLFLKKCNREAFFSQKWEKGVTKRAYPRKTKSGKRANIKTTTMRIGTMASA